MIERASSSVSSGESGSRLLGRTRPSTRSAGGPPAFTSTSEARSRIATSSSSWTLTTTPSRLSTARCPSLYHFDREATKGSWRVDEPVRSSVHPCTRHNQADIWKGDDLLICTEETQPEPSTTADPLTTRRNHVLQRLSLRLGERLIDEGWVSSEQLEAALETRRRTG